MKGPITTEEILLGLFSIGYLMLVAWAVWKGMEMF